MTTTVVLFGFASGVGSSGCAGDIVNRQTTRLPENPTVSMTPLDNSQTLAVRWNTPGEGGQGLALVFTHTSVCKETTNEIVTERTVVTRTSASGTNWAYFGGAVGFVAGIGIYADASRVAPDGDRTTMNPISQAGARKLGLGTAISSVALAAIATANVFRADDLIETKKGVVAGQKSRDLPCNEGLVSGASVTAIVKGNRIPLGSTSNSGSLVLSKEAILKLSDVWSAQSAIVPIFDISGNNIKGRVENQSLPLVELQAAAAKYHAEMARSFVKDGEFAAARAEVAKAQTFGEKAGKVLSESIDAAEAASKRPSVRKHLATAMKLAGKDKSDVALTELATARSAGGLDPELAHEFSDVQKAIEATSSFRRKAAKEAKEEARATRLASKQAERDQRLAITRLSLRCEPDQYENNDGDKFGTEGTRGFPAMLFVLARTKLKATILNENRSSSFYHVEKNDLNGLVAKKKTRFAGTVTDASVVIDKATSQAAVGFKNVRSNGKRDKSVIYYSCSSMH